MAWKWPGSGNNGNSEEWTGFIDQGVTMEGTLTVTGTFRIDGNVKGNVISEQTLILGENPKVEGQIEGNPVGIAGRYDGVIFAQSAICTQQLSQVPVAQISIGIPLQTIAERLFRSRTVSFAKIKISERTVRTSVHS